MLYDTVEIKPIFNNGEWEVLHRELPYERKEGEQWFTSALGKALLRQALEALDSDHSDIQLRTAIALRERLGEKE